MKNSNIKLLLCRSLFMAALLLLSASSAFAQEVLSTDIAYTDSIVVDGLLTSAGETPFVVAQPADFDYKNTPYWQRNKVKNLSATTCLGVGLTSYGVYGIIKVITLMFGAKGFHTWDAVWLGSTTAVTLTSVPLYISAAHDRKKARTLTPEQYATITRDYHKTGLRYELSVGATLPAEAAVGNRLVSYGCGIEGRSYFGESNFDWALRLSFDNTRYDYRDYEYKENNYCVRLAYIVDYNFRKGQNVNPYVGAGAYFSLPFALGVEPRVGVELYDHHRISLGSHCVLTTQDPYADEKKPFNFYLNYGYTF